MCFAHVSPVRHALTSSGLSVVNAPFRECVAFPLSDPNVSVRRIESLPFGSGAIPFRETLVWCHLAQVVVSVSWYSTVWRTLSVFCWLFCCSSFHFSCRFFEFVFLCCTARRPDHGTHVWAGQGYVFGDTPSTSSGPRAGSS